MRIVIFGDSHAANFQITPQLLKFSPALNNIDAQTHVIPGATITGMGRRLSTLRTQETILNSLATQAPSYAIFCFGQVDVELGYFFRQIVKNETILFETFAETIIQQYMLSLRDIVAPNITVIIKGINPPVLIGNHARAVHYTSRIITENVDDANQVEHLTAKLHNTYPDDAERTERHRLFNSLLRSRTSENQFLYFDLMDNLIDNTTGLTDLRFVPAFDDHHISDNVWIRQLYWRGALKLICSVAGQTNTPIPNL